MLRLNYINIVLKYYILEQGYSTSSFWAECGPWSHHIWAMGSFHGSIHLAAGERLPIIGPPLPLPNPQTPFSVWPVGAKPFPTGLGHTPLPLSGLGSGHDPFSPVGAWPYPTSPTGLDCAPFPLTVAGPCLLSSPWAKLSSFPLIRLH